MSVTVKDANIWIGRQLADKEWIEAVNDAANSTVCVSEPATTSVKAWFRHAPVIANTTSDVARQFLRWREGGEIPSDARIVLHNFADQKYVGGFFNKRSSSAQEEHLCANTGIYGVLLNNSKQHELLYENAKQYSTACLNDRFVPMLYSKDVPIAMAYGETKGFGKVDILTAAAYNIRNKEDMSANYYSLVIQQINTMMNFVSDCSGSGIVYFISGAWGCGAFRNDPEFIMGSMKRYINCNTSGDDSRMHLIMAIPGGTNLDVARKIFEEG